MAAREVMNPHRAAHEQSPDANLRHRLQPRVRWTPFFGQIWALDKVELGWWPARPIPRVSRGHESVHGMGAV